MAKISDIAGLTGEMGKDAEVIPEGPGNESTPPEQRASTPVPKRLDKGPKVGESGNYAPAIYKSQRGNVRQDR